MELELTQEEINSVLKDMVDICLRPSEEMAWLIEDISPPGFEQDIPDRFIN